MPTKGKPTGKFRLHPRRVAKLFKVDLRTVFRWITRTHLSSKNGRINKEEVEENLQIWNSTVSLPEAKKRLRVKTASTVTSWRRRKILEEKIVFGAVRITIDSIDRLLAMPTYSTDEKKVFPKSRRSRFWKTRVNFGEYITVHQAADLLEMKPWEVQVLRRSKILPAQLMSGEFRFKTSDVKKIAANRSSLQGLGG